MHVTIVDIEVLTRNWWAVVLRGAVAIVFGILALLAPKLSLAALVLAFGAYAFVDGVFALVSAVRARNQGPVWWLLALSGLAGIAAGLGSMFFPAVTVLVLVGIIAAWSVVMGVFQVAAAIRLRKAIQNEWLLGLGGLLSIALGLTLLWFPGAGALALVVWIGVFALLSGVLFVALGIRLRSFRKAHGSERDPLGPSGAGPVHSRVTGHASAR